MSESVNSIIRCFCIVVGCYFLRPTRSFSQDTAQIKLGAVFEYHPQDFRCYLHANLERRWSHEVQLGVGVRKTIFQQHLNPVFSYRFGFPIHLFRFRLIPGIRTTYAVNRLPIASNHRWLHNTECFFSMQIAYGRTHTVFVSSGIGPGWEMKFDHYLNKQRAFFYWPYYVHLGYAFRIHS